MSIFFIFFEITFYLSILGILYAYLLYPLILIVLVRIKGLVLFRSSAVLPAHAQNQPNRISIIVAARNEEAAIREKIIQTFELKFKDKLIRDFLLSNEVEILVASDASDDQTNNIVREFADQGVRLVNLAERGGKEKAQLEAIKKSTGEILIFTDTKIKLEENAINNFLKYFADEQIGAVSSYDVLDAETSGEGVYVKYEMKLRILEGQLYSIVGLSGSCFAVRKELCSKMRVDLPSDFALLLETIKNHKRGILAPDVLASYKSVKTDKEEYQRKIRTVLRGIVTFFSTLEVLNIFRYGIFSWQILSHKLSRWLVPIWGILGLLSLIVLLLGEPHFLWKFYFGCFCFFVVLAILGFLIKDLQKKLVFKIPVFLLLSNFSILIAWIKFLRGEKKVFWEPSKKVQA